MTVSFVVTSAVAGLALPAMAAPTCDGRPATIVGTNGRDRLVGTPGRDVIVAKGGRDVILGRGGPDRICAGSGADVIEGGGRNDRIFGGSGDDRARGGYGHDDMVGFGGDDELEGGRGRDLLLGGDGSDVLLGDGGADRLLGGANDDALNGGASSDECDQGAGSGPVDDCEVADLSASVDAPGNADKGPVEFSVDVENAGPDGVTYTLAVNERDSGGTGGCEVANENVPVIQAHLGAGQERTHAFVLQCPTGPGAGGSNHVSAIVDAQATDPGPGNDESSSEIVWN